MVLKYKKLLYIILLGVVCILIGIGYFYSVERKGIDGHSVKVALKDNEGISDLSKEESVNSQTNILVKEEKIGLSKIDKVGEYFPDSAYFTIVSLDKAPFSTEKKLEFVNSIKNLYKYGSLSGGKLTHEFSNLDKYRAFLEKYGYEEIKEKISFSPENIPLNDSSLSLTGSYYAGGYTKNKGFDSLYRLYESPNGKKIEINQTKLSPDGMKLLVIEETLNQKVNNVFTTLESFDSEKIYNIRFVHDGYRYAISTKGMNREYLIDLTDYLTSN
ncbi:hypothetical protein ABE427_13010 [Acinetobacter higginsii]|uniref:hypothetical protein n=1 Tax=Acinetobacter higginsii TaxID=70347 RepID=UPI00320947DE